MERLAYATGVGSVWECMYLSTSVIATLSGLHILWQTVAAEKAFSQNALNDHCWLRIAKLNVYCWRNCVHKKSCLNDLTHFHLTLQCEGPVLQCYNYNDSVQLVQLPHLTLHDPLQMPNQPIPSLQHFPPGPTPHTPPDTPHWPQSCHPSLLPPSTARRRR